MDTGGEENQKVAELLNTLTKGVKMSALKSRKSGSVCWFYWTRRGFLYAGENRGLVCQRTEAGGEVVAWCDVQSPWSGLPQGLACGLGGCAPGSPGSMG